MGLNDSEDEKRMYSSEEYGNMNGKVKRKVSKGTRKETKLSMEK